MFNFKVGDKVYIRGLGTGLREAFIITNVYPLPTVSIKEHYSVKSLETKMTTVCYPHELIHEDIFNSPLYQIMKEQE